MARTDAPANPTDAAICGQLAAGLLSTRDLATRLGIPERTVRHRLYRLRQAGTVVSGSDGLHHLAAPVPAASLAGPLPARAAPAGDLAAPVPAAGIAGGLPARAAPVPAAPVAGPLPPRDATAMPRDATAMPRAASVKAPDHPVGDGASPRQGRGWGSVAVRAAGVVGLVVAAGIAVGVAIHRVAPPPPASQARPRPLGFGYPGDPWGGRPW